MATDEDRDQRTSEQGWNMSEVQRFLAERINETTQTICNSTGQGWK